jgi:hypothetical protein
MYGIPCKFSKLVMIILILSLVNSRITNGFKCFLIDEQNSFTIIDVVVKGVVICDNY